MPGLSGFEADWFVFKRLQEVDSAYRVNLIRGLAIAIFFSVLTANQLMGDPDQARTIYFWKSARICALWLMLTGVIAIALKLRTFPPLFKYITTLCDAVLLTATCAIGEMAESTLVIVFLLIIASAYLRYDVPLVLFATGVCLLGYLTLVFETDNFWTREDDQPFPYLEVFRVTAAMMIMGLIGWQACRSVKNGVRRSLGLVTSGNDHE